MHYFNFKVMFASKYTKSRIDLEYFGFSQQTIIDVLQYYMIGEDLHMFKSHIRINISQRKILTISCDKTTQEQTATVVDF